MVCGQEESRCKSGGGKENGGESGDAADMTNEFTEIQGAN